MELGFARRPAREHALEITVPRDAAEDQHHTGIPPADDRLRSPETATRLQRRKEQPALRARVKITRPACVESSRGVEHKRYCDGQAERDQSELERVCVGDNRDNEVNYLVLLPGYFTGSHIVLFQGAFLIIHSSDGLSSANPGQLLGKA